jgi:tRNA nucleotidyltransferase (CCA-adding enzyme)
MNIFLVGGAVRDQLLGRPASDRDYVVVGSNPQEMLDAGFFSVGADFPVFLHPESGEEYALARTERKTGPGYHGFAVRSSPSVTLAEDLRRRDLTINAMAMTSAGDVIDPHGGRIDLGAKVLRHVSASFSEDPVRILRVARLAARFTDFTVAPETMVLMASMTRAGEVDALVPERVWKEVSRGLMEAKPSRMFEVLRECGALARIFPELEALWGVPQRAEHHPEVDTGVHVMMVLDMSARLGAPLDVRFACLCHDLGKGTTPTEMLPRHHDHEGRSVELLHPVCDRWKVPSDVRGLAHLVAAEHTSVHASFAHGPTPLARLIDRCDAFRRPRRFAAALLACECDARGRLGHEESAYPQRQRLLAALALTTSVDTRAVAGKFAALGQSGPAIGEAIFAARAMAVQAGFNALPHADMTTRSAARTSASVANEPSATPVIASRPRMKP